MIAPWKKKIEGKKIKSSISTALRGKNPRRFLAPRSCGWCDQWDSNPEPPEGSAGWIPLRQIARCLHDFYLISCKGCWYSWWSRLGEMDRGVLINIVFETSYEPHIWLSFWRIQEILSMTMTSFNSTRIPFVHPSSSLWLWIFISHSWMLMIHTLSYQISSPSSVINYGTTYHIIAVHRWIPTNPLTFLVDRSPWVCLSHSTELVISWRISNFFPLNARQ